MGLLPASLEQRSEPRMPRPEDLRLVQAVATRIRPRDPRLQAWFRDYLRYHAERIAFDLGHVADWLGSNEDRILDCAAAPFLLPAGLTERGCRVSAVDLAPERFDLSGLPDLEVHRCDIEREALPFPDGTFHLVCFHEILEHLRIDPLHTLREVHRVLQPGGVLLLSTPNLRSFQGIRNLLVRGRGEACEADPYLQYQKLETLGHMGHVREYTPLEVLGLLQGIGFRPRAIVWRGRPESRPQAPLLRLLPALRPFFSLIAVRP